MIVQSTQFVQSNEPIASTIDDEVVMLSVAAGAYFSLNGVGSDIWNLIRTRRRFDEICNALSNQYAVDNSTLTRDVASFLESLAQRGLAQRIESSGQSS